MAWLSWIEGPVEPGVEALNIRKSRSSHVRLNESLCELPDSGNGPVKFVWEY